MAGGLPEPILISELVHLDHITIAGQTVDFTVTNMGEDGRKVFPVLGGLFLFIAVQNILGLIPACDAPTANINTNIGMALFVFLYYNYQGIKRWHGH